MNNACDVRTYYIIHTILSDPLQSDFSSLSQSHFPVINASCLLKVATISSSVSILHTPSSLEKEIIKRVTKRNDTSSDKYHQPFGGHLRSILMTLRLFIRSREYNGGSELGLEFFSRVWATSNQRRLTQRITLSSSGCKN